MPCDRTWPTRAAPLVQTCLDVLHCTSDFRAVMRPAAGLRGVESFVTQALRPSGAFVLRRQERRPRPSL